MTCHGRRISIVLFLAVFTSTTIHAGWLDQLLGGGKSNVVTGAATLSADEMTRGLKEALAQGTEKAIKNLGATNGFLGNLDVKIPMPQKLQEVEKGLRMMKQDTYAD